MDLKEAFKIDRMKLFEIIFEKLLLENKKTKVTTVQKNESF